MIKLENLRMNKVVQQIPDIQNDPNFKKFVQIHENLFEFVQDSSNLHKLRQICVKLTVFGKFAQICLRSLKIEIWPNLGKFGLFFLGVSKNKYHVNLTVKIELNLHELTKILVGGGGRAKYR